MSRLLRVSSGTIAVTALLGAFVLARPASPSEILPANVRPFFAVGPSFPDDFDDVIRGFGMGLGFEIEQSPRVSVLFRVEWNFMSGDISPLYPYSSTSARELTATNWSMGTRAYLARQGPVRPYIDGCVGVRLVRDTFPRGGGIVPLSGTGAVRGRSRRASR